MTMYQQQFLFLYLPRIQQSCLLFFTVFFILGQNRYRHLLTHNLPVYLSLHTLYPFHFGTGLFWDLHGVLGHGARGTGSRYGPGYGATVHGGYGVWGIWPLVLGKHWDIGRLNIYPAAFAGCTVDNVFFSYFSWFTSSTSVRVSILSAGHAYSVRGGGLPANRGARAQSRLITIGDRRLLVGGEGGRAGGHTGALVLH